MEAVFGAEQYKYSERMGPQGAWHNTVLVFTRNVVGPMDYTPVTLSDAKYAHQTSHAHELALSVAFESGVLHFADSPKAYGDLPDAARQFLADVPAAWDETTFVDGEPENSRSWRAGIGSTWWVGRSAGPTPQTITLDLSFLGQGEYDAVILRDGAVTKQVVSESALMQPVDRVEHPAAASRRVCHEVHEEIGSRGSGFLTFQVPGCRVPESRPTNTAEPRNPGTPEPRNPGTAEPRNPEPRNPGTPEPYPCFVDASYSSYDPLKS